MRNTRTVLAAMAAGLMTLSGLTALSGPASAAPQQHNNAPQQQQRGNDHDNGRGNGASEYGSWNTGWGARPPAPPRSFSRHSDWYRHVRACGQRYKSYNPATDRYTVRPGQTAICRL
jgi:hypothetical protein